NGVASGSVRLYQNIIVTWTKIGTDINGEAVGDNSGTSVSLSSDGSVVAIGAPNNNGNGSNSGSVRLYENPNYVKTQIGSDIVGEAAGDESGYSVSLSSDGSVVAIGARYNDGNGSNSGSVRLYKNISGIWTKIGADINGEVAGDESGTSVSLSSDGSVVAIGAPQNDNINGTFSGSVRLYKNISGTWTQIGEDIDGEAVNDLSGTSVSLSSDGSVVAIGAYFNDGNGALSGSVSLYKNISGTWTQIGEDIDGEAASDFSGRSVSLNSDGSLVAIGAIVGGGNGAVRLYQNFSGTWFQIANIFGEALSDQSGYSVSLSSDGSVLAIGAPFNDGNGADSGSVRLYKSMFGSWIQIGEDIDGEAAGDQSGTSVSLSLDGSVVAVGAPFNDGNDADSGSVRLYKNINSTWTKIGSDIDGEAAGDQLGTSVSLSSDGSLVAIGAPFNDANGADAGKVTVSVTGFDIWQGDANSDWENIYNWSNNALPKSNDYVVIPSGSARYPTATKTISVNTIEINNGASFMADYFVNAAVHYKRDITTTDWYIVSSPVEGQDIDVFASAISLASGTDNNRGLATYNNATPGWDYYQTGATGSGNFYLGKGYSIKLTEASTLNYRGTMATLNTDVTISNASNAFNLVGNPYASFIAINASASDAIENLLTVNKGQPDAAAVLEESTLWFWDQSDTYKAVNLASTDVKYIAPGQGFFVKTSATTGNTTSLSFTKAMQSHQTTDTFLKGTNNRTEIKLQVSKNGTAKETAIFYINGTTTDFDNGYDSSIFEGVSASLELFTGLVNGSEDKKLAIQSLPNSNFDTMVIPIGVIAPAGEVTFSANATNLPAKANKVFIEDKELGVFKRLDDASSYTVTLTEASSTKGRFFLHLKSAVLSVPNENLTAINMYYTANSKELHIKGLLEEKATVYVYNVMGKNVFSKRFTTKANTSLMLPNLSTGVYIVQFKGNTNGNITKKIVIE
ncbi:MAG: Flp pilus assembly pilin Flp, partial [Polaribacter sp.]